MAYKSLLENRLHRVGIVGVGLLGGSVGLAIRTANEEILRIGIGRRRSSLNRALAFEAVDEVTLRFDQGLKDVDLVVVATPIGQFPAMFRAMADHLPDGCIVTDVGSTKEQIIRWAKELLPKRVHFVGSHPMAGSEKTGVDYARADLFEGAPCLVTPTSETNRRALRTVKAFWKALGGHVLTMSPGDHDCAMSEISHLPHALAAVLVESVSSTHHLRLASTGFQDTTRIASGSAELWRDIFLTNQRCTTKAIDRYIRALQSFRRALQHGDEKTITNLLSAAKKRRDEWIASKYSHREVQA